MLNRQEVKNYIVFQAKEKIDKTKPLKRGTYQIVIDYAWRSKKDYSVTLDLVRYKSLKHQIKEIKGRSPESGGILGSLEGFYRVYQIEEPIGLERIKEICSMVITAPKSEIEEGIFQVFDNGLEIPYQILEKKESNPSEKAVPDHPTTVSYKIAFPLTVEAGGKKLITVLKGEHGFQTEKNFVITGEGLGKTVQTDWIKINFHPQSGQINTIDFLKEGLSLYNKAGVIHWNPDVFVPGLAWDHSFDWNPPEIFEEINGNFLYLNSRKGFLPRIKDVWLEVKYIIEIDSPYFISETLLSFNNDLGVIAVRNDEMVLFKELFDSFILKTKEGKVVRGALKEKEGVPFGLIHNTWEDVDWVGLVNSRQGYGFFSLRIKELHANLDASGDFLYRPGTYFYAPSDGNYVYWVRPLIYTWADYMTNNLLTFVPKGSLFYEKNAYIGLKLTPDTEEKLNLLLTKLRNPLKVF